MPLSLLNPSCSLFSKTTDINCRVLKGAPSAYCNLLQHPTASLLLLLGLRGKCANGATGSLLKPDNEWRLNHGAMQIKFIYSAISRHVIQFIDPWRANECWLPAALERCPSKSAAALTFIAMIKNLSKVGKVEFVQHCCRLEAN